MNKEIYLTGREGVPYPVIRRNMAEDNIETGMEAQSGTGGGQPPERPTAFASEPFDLNNDREREQRENQARQNQQSENAEQNPEQENRGEFRQESLSEEELLEIKKIANLWKKRDPQMSDDEAMRNAWRVGIPREFVSSVNPIEITKRIMGEMSDFQKIKDSLKLNVEPDGRGGLRAGAGSGYLGRKIFEQVDIAWDPRRASEAEERILEYVKRLNAAQDINNLEELRHFVNTEIFTPLFTDRDKHLREERGLNTYESLNEILSDVMIQSGGDFARDGKYALITQDENGVEIIQQQNVIRWFRDRMYEYHDSDVDNPLDLFKMIQVIGGARATSASDWIFTPAMMTDRQGNYLKGLREQIYMELWLFNKSRNYDAQYRKIMGNDEKLPEVLQEMYLDNTFTKEGTMDRILTLPTIVNNMEFIDREGIRDADQSTGKALRRALLAYYHIQDVFMLNQIEEGQIDTKGKSEEQIKKEKEAKHFMSALFDNKAFLEGFIQRKLEEGEGDILRRHATSEAREKARQEIREKAKKEFETDWLTKSKTREFFMDDGKGGIDQSKLQGYLEQLNPFIQANKDFERINETKERIRLLIMKETGITYEEAKYAETFAYSMTRWTGLAARHDARASAYDSWSKVIQTAQYRDRQAGPNQGGIHGNPYSLAGFKKMGVDFLAGAKDVNGNSILEIIQGGQGDVVDLGELDEVKFENLAMEKFGTDHIARVFKLYQTIIETHEFNFDKFIKVDQWGRVIFDPKASMEFQDVVLKAFRYGYRTWGGTDYSKMVRVKDYKTGEIKNVSIAESLWGAQIYRDFVEEKLREEGVLKKKEKLEAIRDQEQRSREIGRIVQKNRGEFWKRPLMYMIAAEIYAHRETESGFERYKLSQIQKIYDWLHSFSGKLKFDEEDLKNTERVEGEEFFSKKEIEWMRKASDTTSGWLYTTEIISQTPMGVIEGLGASAKSFFNYVFKEAA